ncbi:MAG: tRNA (adenosine(37)-N6)-dimethylallyltransferase MiaA [Thermodesulfobacteriota bacterium]
MDEKQKLVVITGPTASGKSSMAVKLALRFGAEIVNADSMQVYRGMDVGTAKPSLEERQGIPHHLLDVVEPNEQFNAALYRSHALEALREIRERGKTAFVVGGTGLYIKSLLGGLMACPPADPGLRERLREEYEREGGAVLHRRLRELDPESAGRIHPRDTVRLLRALEVIQLSGKALSTTRRMHAFGERPFHALKICLQMEREQLYHRINERCLWMIQEGLIGETEALLRKGFSPDLKPMKSLGYRHIVRFLRGDWDRSTAVRELQADTRRYAKRQLTWFRADPELILLRAEDEEGMALRIRDFLGELETARDLR